MRYLAIKEGWDGRIIRKPGEVFTFEGERGSWMVPCDENGKPLKGESVPAEQRPGRLGAKQATGQGRDALRERCKELGIQFKATLGAPALAELIQKREDEIEQQRNQKTASPENPDGGAPGVGGGEGGGKAEAPAASPGGTGNLEVL